MNRTITSALLIIFCLFIMNCFHQKENNLEQLKSLPYISWTKEGEDESLSGVVTYNRNKAFAGYNLFEDRGTGMYLMDMEGEIVYKWKLPKNTKGLWEYALLKENGNLIAECVDCKNIGAVEVTWNSGIVWKSDLNFHHDVELLPDDSYLIPDRIMTKYKKRNVNFDRIVHISNKGKVLDIWSTWEQFATLKKYHEPHGLDNEPDISEELLDKYDYYHLNTIKLLPPNNLGYSDHRFQPGNWLICLRNVNLICILDKDTKDIVWYWGPGELKWPHLPTMLENGDILVFDNGVGRDYTRVVQVNPLLKTITWEYKTDPPEQFYTYLCGSAQRFPNGNTLIADSDSGHAFEVTEQGEIVWDFYHFKMGGDRRKIFYRMIRYPKKMVDTLLKQSG
ncbi:MAG: aryl-sulfate sulfotransferase [Spirochaetales bacterium]|nr:aryl-sulfate sulfotransferase [Spirochaetales bacterium]